MTTLENESLRVEINSSGAEMCSFFDKHNQLECLWQADARYWGRHAPILFPIVGRLMNDELVHHNQHYPMSQHGFARDSQFDILSRSKESITLSLTSNKSTHHQYPFDFELIVKYVLQDNRLLTSYRICNPNKFLLPASIGAHPAFNWPLLPSVEKKKHFIQFETTEEAKIRRLEKGLILEKPVSNPINKNRLYLTDDLFAHDALIFDQLNSRKLTYSANKELEITLQFTDFPHLGIWTKPGAPFICLEPWQGYSSPINFDGDISLKPEILLIAPQSESEKSFEIILKKC